MALNDPAFAVPERLLPFVGESPELSFELRRGSLKVCRVLDQLRSVVRDVLSSRFGQAS